MDVFVRPCNEKDAVCILVVFACLVVIYGILRRI